MTKQEAINRAWTLLEVLEALPDSADILTAEARTYNGILSPLYIHLSGGIEAVGTKLGLPILSRNPEDTEYTYREIHTKHGEYLCEYCQLDEKAAPGVGSTEGGKAEQGPTKDNPIIDTGKEEVKP